MPHHLRLILATLCLLPSISLAFDDTPLHVAVRKCDLAEVKKLLDQGANANARNYYGQAPLHDVATKEVAKCNNWNDIADQIVARGGDVNARNNDASDSRTPLHDASREGLHGVVKFLLSKGAQVNVRDKNGFTPLYGAAGSGSKDTTQVLIENGADVNASGHGGAWGVAGSSPLHQAANKNHKDVARLLIARGANIFAKDKAGRTPMDWALFRGQETLDVVTILEEQILARVSKYPGGAIVGLSALLKENPEDQGIQRVAIKHVARLNRRISVPEEARRYFVEGSAIVRASKSPEQAKLAVDSFRKATAVAPWWAEAYYNLGVAQELAKDYDGAEKSFQLYLLSEPNPKETREVQDRIYALGAKKKLGQ